MLTVSRIDCFGLLQAILSDLCKYKVNSGWYECTREIGEGCFEMECVKKIRAPARCKVQRAPVPEKITAHPGKFGCARGGRAKFHGFGCWPVQFLIKKIISLKF
jgi:hypothetical protein